jgi:hypothetical protein
VAAWVGLGLVPMIWRSGNRRLARENLKTSETTEITLSDLNPDGLGTTSVTRDSPHRFLRLVVDV